MTADILDFPAIFQKYKKYPFIISDNAVYSYWDIIQSIEFNIKKYQQGGIKKGDYVGISAKSKPETIVCVLTLIQMGAVPVLLNPKLLPQKRIELLKQVGSPIMICSKIDREVENAVKCLPEISMQQSLENAESKNIQYFRPISLDQHATVMFTSGSSGKAKACVHTLGNHYYSALGSNQNIMIAPGDRWLLVLPINHMGGISIIFRTMLSGAAVVMPDDINTVSENIVKHDTSHISLVPTQLYRLLHSGSPIPNWSGLKAVLVGGDKVQTAIIRNAVQNKIPIHTSYGSTEMASQITTTPAGASETALASSGKILPHRQIKIDTSGEILVRGKTLFRGYIEQGKIASGTDKDGWFHSGDIGWLDKNDYLYVVGRKDNMFICGGENIYPEEIERALLHIDYIERALVVAVRDKEYGHIPVAFLSFTFEPMPFEEIKIKLSETLPKFFLPRKILEWPGGHMDSLKPDRVKFTNLAERILLENDYRLTSDEA